MSSSLPSRKSLTIHRYERLRQIVSTLQRDINFLLITGGPGLGKSRVVEHALAETATFVRGAATAYGLYRKLYDVKDDAVVVLDDLDGLLADPKTWSLLKSLTESTTTKEISWLSMAPERDGLPSTFTTNARTVLIVNHWPTQNQHAAALVDRAIPIHFQPSHQDVHAEAGRWFRSRSPQVYEFIGRHLPMLLTLSFRTYLAAQQLKSAGGDLWKEYIRSCFMDGTLAEVAALLDDTQSFQSDRDRIQVFSGSSATFKRAKNKLKQAGLWNPEHVETAIDHESTVKFSDAG